jgi:hypothetical protein
VEVLGDTTGAAVAESIYADGRLQFETIERARIGIAAALESLQKASALLESAPPPNIGRLSNALDAARAQVDQLVPRATAAENLLDAIPQMLGRDEPRRYLVALQGLGEARATGGLIGLYGVMEAVEGKLYLVSAGRTVELTMNPRHPLDDGILAPSWFAKRYGNLDFSSVNASPSFPFVARSLLNLFKAVTGRQLDGVWSFDAVAFQELTKATGPLRGPGFNVPLGPENATRVLVEDAYDHFATDPEALTRYLLGLINDLYRSIDERNADPRTLLQSVADSAAGGHFNIYSRVSEEQDTLHSLGLDGALDTESVAQLVYHNNLEGNKVDFLLERQITTAIKLMPDRSAQVVTEVSLVNRAESGPPSILLGIPTQGQRPGVNNMELDFVLTRDIADVDLTIDGERFVPTLGLEGSLPVASLRVELAPGEQKKVALSYTLKGVQRFIESGRDFSFTLVPQPRPYPDTYRVKVTAPTGFGLLRDDASVTARPSGDLTFKGILDRSTQIDVRIVPR